MGTAAEWVVWLLDHVVPARADLVVLHSTPDLDDNVLALLRVAPPGIKTVVLADNRSAANRRVSDLGLPPTRIVSKDTLVGLWSYLRSTYAISTHGLFGSRPRGPRKTSSTPWHGELSKPIGVFLGRRARHFDHLAVSSQSSKILRVAEFYLPPANIHVIGTPRLATLGGRPRSAQVQAIKKPEDAWVLFVPTYRQSRRSPIDYQANAPVDETVEAIEQVARTLAEQRRGTLWVRPHPLSDPDDYSSASTRLATDSALQDQGLTLYDMLAATDILITDYSSIWVDFLSLDRPVVGFCPDIENYRRARGLALEPYESWFPGPIVERGEDLRDEIARLLGGADLHAQRRQTLRDLLTQARPGAAQDYWTTLIRHQVSEGDGPSDDEPR